MIYGIKLWSINSDLYSDVIKLYFEKFINYLELTIILDKPLDNLDILIESKIPIIIHAPTLNQGICFSDDNFDKNKDYFNKLLEIADKLNALGIIVHPSFGKKENFIKFLKEFKSANIIIENMPKLGLNDVFSIGFTVEEIKEFLSIGNFKFCLDVGHSTKSALSQNIDYKTYIKRFMELNPFMYHIMDFHLDNEYDEHLDFGKGDVDLQFIKSVLPQSARITFEVPKGNRLNNDMKNIKYFDNL